MNKNSPVTLVIGALLLLAVPALCISYPMPELGAETKLKAYAGNPEAQYELGMWYFEGINVKQDLGQAAKWVAKAADQKYPYAQYTLGFLYLQGKGVTQSDEKGLDLLHKAAEQGMPGAQGFLAYIYGQGIGVEQDQDKFLHWTKLAAQNGDAASQFHLAILCLTGDMVERNTDQARALLDKAAEQGHLEAMGTLGEYYMLGLGGNPDYVSACKWFAIAGTKGHAKSNYMLGQITDSMTREQMQDAAIQANQWLDAQEG